MATFEYTTLDSLNKEFSSKLAILYNFKPFSVDSAFAIQSYFNGFKGVLFCQYREDGEISAIFVISPPLLLAKGLIKNLLKISKLEKFALVEKYPDLQKEIYRTARQRSNRGNYYVPCYSRVLEFLEDYWSSKITQRAGAANG